MRPWRALVAGLLLAIGKGKRYASSEELDPSERQLPGRRNERVVAVLLALTGVGGIGFFVVYLVFPDTQALGGALGATLACLAAALIVAGNGVVVQETTVEERPELVDEQAEQEASELLHEGGEGISRRKLLGASAGVAGIGLGAALITPLASLGPNVSQRIDATPWRRGSLVVDEHGEPYLASEVEVGSFQTGFPKGADMNDLGAPIVIVRIPVEQIDLPFGRRQPEWAPDGIMAYSKICTHAGCAVSLFRYPLYQPTTPQRPALVCPCHYSTFDVAKGAERVFGPAGRPLPQLPLAIDARGRLVANGPFSGSIGPAWFNVTRPS